MRMFISVQAKYSLIPVKIKSTAMAPGKDPLIVS